MRPSTKANLILLLVAMIWGGGFVAGKMALTGTTAFAILGWRFSISAAVCGLLFRKRIRKTPRRVILSGICIGCLHVLALGTQLIGLGYTTSAKQSFLCTAYVAMTPWLSWLIAGKKPSVNAVLGGVLALAGIGSIESLTIHFGDLLSLCFAVLFGIQVVLVGKFVSRDTDSYQLTFYQFLTAGLVSLLICLLRGEPMAVSGAESLIGVAYLSVINTCLAFLLQNAAQRHTSDVMASLIISLESVFGFLFSVLYYHESLTWRLLLGGALCFAAILLNAAAPQEGSGFSPPLRKRPKRAPEFSRRNHEHRPLA